MGQGTQAMEMRKKGNRVPWWDQEEKPKQKTLDEFVGEKK